MKKGVSLLELLIYLAIFSIVVVFLVSIFSVVIRSRATANARFEVIENLRSALEKMQQTVFDASLVLATGSCALNTLEARVGTATTTFQVTGGVLKITEGVNPAADVTSPNVTVGTNASCMFTRIDNPAPARPTLQIKVTVRYNDGGRPELTYSDTSQITISLR